MTSGLKCRLLDLGFVTALLLAAAVPLVCLRGSPLLFRTECLTGLPAVLAATVALWVVLARRARGTVPPADVVPQSQSAGEDGWAWWRPLFLAALLGAVTLVTFYRPLQIHFWGGADEFLNFQDRPFSLWMHDWEKGMNRPFTILPCILGQTLTPGRIEGFLWLAVGLCWVNGLLLFAILRELLPQARLLPAAAAVLLIIDRSDPSRFFVMWASNYYWLALAFLLLGVWLFLRSYRRGSRPLLALSCAALGAALLVNEASYPLAVLAPALAWCLREHRRRLPVWTYAWAGTLALFATRFLLFLAHQGSGAYQATQATGVLRNPWALLHNLLIHLKAGLTNFQTSGADPHSWKAAVAALVLGVVLVAFAAWRAEGPLRRRYALVLGVAALALLLGTVPFLPMPYVFRTQFFAAPGQAVLLAGALCLAGSLLGRRVGTAIVALAVGLLAANGTSEAISAQRHDRALAAVNFERTTHIFRQIHGVCPNPAPGTFIVLVPHKRAASPLGCNYACLDLAQHILKANMVQVGVRDGLLPPPAFHADSVSVGNRGGPGPNAEGSYDKVLAFQVTADGTVSLLRRLPDSLLPLDNTAARYDPLTTLRPGRVKELAYLRYPRWADRPRDLFDMADGVLLGQGWGPLECCAGDLSRQAAAGAELVVNPLGQDRRELRLLVEGGAARRLEALNLDGKVVATADLGGRREVCLTVPTDPTRVSLICLRAVGGTGAFRVFYRGGKVTNFRPPPTPPPDILADDLELGDNWHGLETQNGERWRWVANDAEVVVGTLPAGRAQLVLEVEPGPGLRGQPCRLSLLDQTGRVLAKACVQRREEIRLPLPARTKAGAVLRLHVEGHSVAFGPDTRILSFRIFRGTLKATGLTSALLE